MAFKKRTKYNQRGKRRNVRKIHRRKKVKYTCNQNMISYFAPKSQPFPPRYRCKMVMNITGSIGIGSASGQYVMVMNDLVAPLTTEYVQPLPNMLVTTIASQPIGFTSLCNANLYGAFRVYGSKLSFNVAPSALADTVKICTIPVTGLAATTITSTPLSINAIQEQPLAKSLLVSSSRGNGKPLSNFATVAKVAGFSKRAIEDDISLNFEGLYFESVTLPLYWIISWETPDAVVLATPLNYDAKLEFYVELFSRLGGQLTGI